MICNFNGMYKSEFCEDGIKHLIGNSVSVKFNKDKFINNCNGTNFKDIKQFSTKKELYDYCLENNITFNIIEDILDLRNEQIINNKIVAIYNRTFNPHDKEDVRDSFLLCEATLILHYRVNYTHNGTTISDIINWCSDNECIVCSEKSYHSKSILNFKLSDGLFRSECICNDCIKKLGKNNDLGGFAQYNTNELTLMKIMKLKANYETSR